MPQASVGGRHLFYETVGEGEPLVLLAGLGDDHHLFDLHRGELARRHRLVLLDHRDAGASDEADTTYGLGDLAADVLAVVDHLKIERVHILGVSMGGAVAQHVALQAPHRVASLVLASTWGRTDAFLRAVLEGWRSTIDRLTTDEFLAAQAPWLYGARFLTSPTPEVATLWLAARARGWPRSVAAFKRQIDACVVHDVLATLFILQTPALALVGEEDILTSPRYARALAAMLGRGEVGLVPGGGHAVLLENPKAFTERVLRFLAGQAMPRGRAA